MNAEATAVRNAKRVGAGGWAAGSSPEVAVGAAVRLMTLPLRLLATPLGRRVVAATVLSIVLLGVVSTLYANADGPRAAKAATLQAVPAAAKAATPSRAAAAKAPARAATARPEDAAVAWYARRQGVATDRVHALQRQRVDANTTRVLVMAEVSATKLPTDMVTVERDRSGWKVP